MTDARMTKRPLVLGIALLLGLHAQLGRADSDHEEARRLKEAGAILPLETIIHKAQTVHAGRILEAELKTRHGDYYYEIELLDEAGRVWELRLNARNGQLLNQGKEEDD
jgi:uncharacterized membrane protein YkoI